MKHRDIALSAAALLLPTGAIVGTALALLKPAPDALDKHSVQINRNANTIISPLGSGRCGADAPVGRSGRREGGKAE
jgi:hypothetical protein